MAVRAPPRKGDPRGSCIEVRHAYGMSQGNLHLKAVLSWQKFRAGRRSVKSLSIFI